MPEFNDWFSTSRYGGQTINVMSFGAYGDGIAHALSTLGFASVADAKNGVGGNGKAYPSATDLGQTADWCAITEAIKHAFKHETSPGSDVWEWNGTAKELNRPLYFPSGRYIVRHSLRFVSIEGAYIYGDPGTNIHHEFSNVEGQPVSEMACVSTNGFSYTRVENLAFSTAGGATSVAFDSNCDGGPGSGGVATVNNNACLFISCDFSAPDGVGLNIADPATPSLPGSPVKGIMGSEMVFIRCTANMCSAGFVIQNWNALNYTFIGCGGTACTTSCIAILAGGMVTIMNGSLAGNTLDINVACSTCVIIATRTESRSFVRAGGPTAIIGCTQSWTGSDGTFVEVLADTSILNSMSYARIYGGAPLTLDGNMLADSSVLVVITSIAAGAGGTIKISHEQHPGYVERGTEWWMDGDEIDLEYITSTGAGAASVNGTWTIHKLNHLQFECVGSTYVADTYNLASAHLRPSRRWVWRNPNTGVISDTKASAVAARMPQDNWKKSTFLVWADSGRVFTNDGATTNIVFRLPALMGAGYFPLGGTRFTFMVLAAHEVKIEVDPIDPGDAYGETARLFRVGGYATAGTSIACSTVGASVEIYMVESNIQSPLGDTHIGHRWLVRAEEGTWTIAGTPA